MRKRKKRAQPPAQDTRLEAIAQEPPEEATSQFSLFEGDMLNSLFARYRLGMRHPLHLVGRILLVLSITWVPMAIMSYFTPLPAHPVTAQDFFYDFAAYAQFFVGLPLFIIAEHIVSENLLSAARDFEMSGVVADRDKEELARIEREVTRLRRWRTPEYICLAVGFVLSLCTIGPELFWDSDMQTWHVIKFTPDERYLTPAGAWEMFVALPIQIFWWLRWMWKIGLWYWYLSRISTFQLVLAASHPDMTGGLSFLSEVQAKFAIVILAFGISNVVATIGYKIAIEHAPVDLPPVWGPVVGFIIGAPLLFLCPLLLFTKQLARTKKRALAQFREKAMRCAIQAEQQWMLPEQTEAQDEIARMQLSQLNLFSGFYDRIHRMRVVPFDLRSAAQLIGSAIGPVLPLIPHFVKLPEQWQHVLPVLTKWLPH